MSLGLYFLISCPFVNFVGQTSSEASPLRVHVNFITMNASISKIENATVDESERPQPLSPDTRVGTPPDSSVEIYSEEVVEKRLYRRSVAYFLFGFGYNKHSIVTDEPGQ